MSWLSAIVCCFCACVSAQMRKYRCKGTKKNGYVQEKLVFIIRDNVFGMTF
jgi:hypothetical protein